jgi:hypothetical protein
MRSVLKFAHAGKLYEARAALIAGRWVVRVFCEGDAVSGVGYSALGGSAPIILMEQARRDVQSGHAAENARIAAATDNQMQSLRSLAARPNRRRPKK